MYNLYISCTTYILTRCSSRPNLADGYVLCAQSPTIGWCFSSST